MFIPTRINFSITITFLNLVGNVWFIVLQCNMLMFVEFLLLLVSLLCIFYATFDKGVDPIKISNLCC